MEIKHIDDYYDKIKEAFPELDEKEIEKILTHGMKSVYLINLYGADLLLKNNQFTMYFGEMFKDAKKFWKYWHFKSALKLRIKYKRKKEPFNGYYYFGLTEEEYLKYKMNKKGRKFVTFDEIFIFKIKEEAFLDKGKTRFYSLAMKEEKGFKERLENFKTSNFSLIATRASDGKINLI